MDRIFKTDELDFVSKPISVRKFFEECVEAENAAVSLLSENPMAMAGPSSEAPEGFERMFEYDNPQRLRHNSEFAECLTEAIPNDTLLFTLEVMREEQVKRQNLAYRQIAVSSCPYYKYDIDKLFSLEQNVDGKAWPYVPEDVVLEVFVLRPHSRDHCQEEPRHGRLANVHSIFLVRGKQCLTELRDRISCPCDLTIVGDCSEDPDHPPTVVAKDVFPGGFFYIEGTFYNDTRVPGATDLSDVIIEWAKLRPNEIGPFKRAKMEETTFLDLTLRLGQFYVYKHQGDCEHLLLFSDLRALHRDNPQNIKDYPISLARRFKRRVVCVACKKFPPRWIVKDGDRMPGPIVHMCNTCFREFNYDEKGKKIGHFIAAPFADRVVV